jgi:hypothetical protein
MGVDGAFPVGRAVERVVMQQDGYAIGGQMHVELDPGDPEPRCGTE